MLQVVWFHGVFALFVEILGDLTGFFLFNPLNEKPSFTKQELCSVVLTYPGVEDYCGAEMRDCTPLMIRVCSVSRQDVTGNKVSVTVTLTLRLHART